MPPALPPPFDGVAVEVAVAAPLHGYAIKRRLEGGRNGTDFSLISADYLGFVPKKICE